MAMRFDQIGSAQNVQQVGQGEAYVQDKYENPLLGVGKMTASLAQANRKAQIAAAKLAKPAKQELIDFGRPHSKALGDVNESLAKSRTAYSNAQNEQEASFVSNDINKGKNTVNALSDYYVIGDAADKKRSELANAPGGSQIWESKLNREWTAHENEGSNIFNSNGRDFNALEKKTTYLASKNPNLFIENNIVMNDAELAKRANDLGTITKRDFKGFNPLNNGYNKASFNENKATATANLVTYINDNYKTKTVQNTFLQKLEENPNDPRYMKYVSTDQKDGFEDVGIVNSKGEPIYVKKDEYVYSRFKDAIASKLSESDKDMASFLQDYNTGSFKFGVGGNSKAKYIVDDGGEQTISSTVYNAEGPNAVNVETYIPSTISYASKDGGGKLPVINFANQNVTDHSAGGDNKTPHRNVSRGNIAIQNVAPGITFDGKVSPLLQLPKGTTESADAYYNLIKDQFDKGVFNKNTKLNVDVVGFGKIIKNAKDDSDYNGNSDDVVKEIAQNRLKTATTQSSLILNQTSLNALNAGSNRIVSKGDFMNMNSAKMQKEAIDRINKEFGAGGNTTGDTEEQKNKKRKLY